MNCPLFNLTIWEVVPRGDLFSSIPPGVLAKGLLELFINLDLLISFGVAPLLFPSTLRIYPSAPMITCPLWLGRRDIMPFVLASFGEMELLLSWSRVFWFGLRFLFWNIPPPGVPISWLVDPIEVLLAYVCDSLIILLISSCIYSTSLLMIFCYYGQASISFSIAWLIFSLFWQVFDSFKKSFCLAHWEVYVVMFEASLLIP